MRIKALLVLVVLASSGACAQKARPATLGALQPQLPPGTRVYVTQPNGDEVSGQLEAISPDTLRLRVDDGRTRDLAEADVSEIAVRDPYWLSMLIGAGAGALAFNAIGEEGCTSPMAAPDCRRVSRGEGTATFAAIGAGVGFLIDFFRKETVFEGRPAQETSTRVGAMVGKNRVGVVVSREF